MRVQTVLTKANQSLQGRYDKIDPLVIRPVIHALSNSGAAGTARDEMARHRPGIRMSDVCGQPSRRLVSGDCRGATLWTRAAARLTRCCCRIFAVE
jgi:hypothetical protein